MVTSILKVGGSKFLTDLDAQRLKKFRKFVGTILPTQIYENPRVYPCYTLPTAHPQYALEDESQQAFPHASRNDKGANIPHRKRHSKHQDTISPRPCNFKLHGCMIMPFVDMFVDVLDGLDRRNALHIYMAVVLPDKPFAVWNNPVIITHMTTMLILCSSITATKNGESSLIVVCS